MTSVDKKSTEVERHTISVLVDNEAGVLARVIGLFSSRGYNIESLTVSEVEHKEEISRITIVTSGSPVVIEHIIALLERIVPVYTVSDLTTESPHIEREVGLIKVAGSSRKRAKALEVADRFGARTVDSSKKSFIFELSDTPDTLDQLINLLKPLGLTEVCRTGVTAIARGDKGMDIDD